MTDRLELQLWRRIRGLTDWNAVLACTLDLLREQMPAAAIAIRGIHHSRNSLDTLAFQTIDGPLATEPLRTDCTPAQFKRVHAWCKQGKPMHGLAKELHAGLLACVLPSPQAAASQTDALLIPMFHDNAPVSVAVILSEPETRFAPHDAQLAMSVSEPLAAAIVNDRHHHELMALRQAAEADKQSLLSRLGREQLSDVIIGQNHGLRLVFERIHLVTKTDTPVLILGETGSGKEVVARAIHMQSHRAKAPFMRVNCGAIPPELIDSELFGHEKGSFTGAIGIRQGWFERSDGGTLFLDEIGELPLAAQVRLLRVLQDGAFERVGGHTPLTVDVRLIAATHRDLPAMIDEGRFREDLWYRIATFPVRLPPLRERLEDIPELVAHFAQKAARRFGLLPQRATESDLRLLRSYHWPGNVRELAAVVDRAAILGEGHRLEIAKALGVEEQRPASALQNQRIRLPASTNRGPRSTTTLADDDFEVQRPQPGFESLDQAMTRHICMALDKCRGRIEGPHGAAALLGINPHTLRARMRKLGIDWRAFRSKATDS